jgi:hypothetical protein
MAQAEGISEMLINFYQTTWCYKPEDSHLQGTPVQDTKRELNSTTLHHQDITGISDHPDT